MSIFQHQKQKELGQVLELKIIGGRSDDFIDTFEFIKDECFHFFSDLDDVKTKEDFKRFYKDKIFDICVARDEYNNIVCCSYVFINGYKSFGFSGYNREDYRSPKYSVPAAKIALKYFFDRYDVNRIDAAGINDNRVSRLMTERLGFKRIGVIPKLLPHQGILKDYYCSFILKEV